MNWVYCYKLITKKTKDKRIILQLSSGISSTCTSLLKMASKFEQKLNNIPKHNTYNTFKPMQLDNQCKLLLLIMEYNS